VSLRRALSFAVLTLAPLAASAARAEDSGLKVTVTLAAADGKLPAPEKMVHALEAVGGERQVLARLEKGEKSSTATFELWGHWAPSAEVATLLRQAQPVLAKADIQVTTLDASQKHTFDDKDVEEMQTPADGHGKRVVKKVIIER
jgi:hypothetical protein